MRIEKERLRLLPHQLIQSSDGRFSILKKDGTEVDLPDDFKNYYQWAQQGLSLAQIAKGLIAERHPRKFASLAGFMTYLADSGLLADKAAARMADSLRSDYRWPESIAFEPLVDQEIVRFRRHSVSESAAYAVAIFVIAIGIVSLMGVLSALWSGRAAQEAFSTLEGWTLLTWLGSFFAVFAFGRTVSAILRVLVLHFSSGSEVALRLRIEPVAVSLSSDELSKTNGNVVTLIGGLGAIFALAVPCWFVGRVPVLRAFEPAVLFWTALLLLAELSPFVRSSATDLLRAFYNHFDRVRGVRAQGEGLEALVKRAHVTMCVLWCVGFGFFLVGPWFEWIRHVRPFFDPRSGSSIAGAALLALSQGVILFSFVNDLMSSISYGTGDDRRLVRRLFSRKSHGVGIEEAVLQGRVPPLDELEALPLLRQLEPGLRREFLKHAKVVSLKEGEAVCRQGGTDRSLFIVLAGRLAVAKSMAGRKRKVVAFLDAGAVFGEAAFFLGKNRMADVVCMEESVVLEIAHDPKFHALDKDRSEELQLRIWFLQALLSGSFLRDLPSEALDALVFAGKKKTFSAGASIMREGEDANACYFIVQGKATVLQNGRTINKIQNGDAFGEIALLNPGSPRTASVVAESDMITIMIESASFWDLLASHLPLAIEIERLAARRVSGDRDRKPRAA